jgi:transcriptional regulator with XRE-family HTH domain
MKNNMNAGKCLQIYQAISGINSTELAVLTGVSKVRVSQWRKQHGFSEMTVRRLCEVFGVTREAFFSVGKLVTDNP